MWVWEPAEQRHVWRERPAGAVARPGLSTSAHVVWLIATFLTCGAAAVPWVLHEMAVRYRWLG